MTIGVVSCGWLAEQQRAGRARTIVDARRRREFAAGHIPGSVRVGWEEWCERAPDRAGPILAQPGYWGALAEAAPPEYQQRLREHGVDIDRPVIVYADGPASKGREGRIAWMLLYLGAPSVSLLDGGWTAWRASGGEVEIEATTAPVGGATIRLQPQRRRTLQELRLAYDAGELPPLADVRSPAEFDGHIQEYLPRRGHLPGAVLVPFAGLFDAAGSYLSSEEYLAQLPPSLLEADTLVAYCEVGVRAALFALLHEVYTGRIVPIFDGSLMQWSLEADLPMASAG